ncbi:MAG: hypothetical protein WCT08_04945 [Patescibacteria group bacterium]
MVQSSLKKPRIVRVYRAIIWGRRFEEASEAGVEYLLFQRSRTVHFPNMWECLGATPEPDEKDKAKFILPKGSWAEAGIKISKIQTEVFRFQRKIANWPGSRYNGYDFYESVYYLVDCATIRGIDLCPQHRGSGWFPLPAILALKPVLRESTFQAFLALKKIDLSKYQVNSKHH